MATSAGRTTHPPSKGDNIYIHQLLAIAEHGFDEVAGKHIHHKNGIKWDNALRTSR